MIWSYLKLNKHPGKVIKSSTLQVALISYNGSRFRLKYTYCISESNNKYGSAFLTINLNSFSTKSVPLL